jgi:hypothetical protein
MDMIGRVGNYLFIGPRDMSQTSIPFFFYIFFLFFNVQESSIAFNAI